MISSGTWWLLALCGIFEAAHAVTARIARGWLWIATSGWLARPYGYSGIIGNTPEGMISGTGTLPM